MKSDFPSFLKIKEGGGIMVFSTTFNNIFSYIMAVSCIG